MGIAMMAKNLDWKLPCYNIAKPQTPQPADWNFWAPLPLGITSSSMFLGCGTAFLKKWQWPPVFPRLSTSLETQFRIDYMIMFDMYICRQTTNNIDCNLVISNVYTQIWSMTGSVNLLICRLAQEELVCPLFLGSLAPAVLFYDC